jgi:hypothetical protein
MIVWEKQLYREYGKISINEYNRIVIQIGDKLQIFEGSESIAVIISDLCGNGFFDQIPAGNERLNLLNSLIYRLGEAFAVQSHTVSVKPSTKKNEKDVVLLWLKHHGYD